MGSGRHSGKGSQHVSPPASPGDADAVLGRDLPQQKPDLGHSRTKNNLPAAREERRAKRAQITHMSGGESSAPIFGDNGGGKHGFQCNSRDNSKAVAKNSLQAFLGSKAADGQYPQGPILHLGKSCRAWELHTTVVQLCRGAERPARSLLPPQEAAAAARAAGSPENLQTHAGWEGVLSPPVAPAAITQKCTLSPSRGERCSEQAGEAGKKIQMCKPNSKEAPGFVHILCQPPARGSWCSHTLCFPEAARAPILTVFGVEDKIELFSPWVSCDGHPGLRSN